MGQYPFFTPFVRSNEFYLAKTLEELGYQVTVVTTTAKSARECKSQQKYNSKIPFQVKYSKTLLKKTPVFDENPLAPLIWKALDEGYDIIHLQEDFPLICQFAFLYAKCHSIPAIISSERYYYPTSLPKKLALLGLDATIHKIMWNKVDVITTHTTEAKKFFCDHGVRADKIKVIPVGVDTELFKYRESDFLRNRLDIEEGIIILCVARLHPYKGLSYLIQAMSKVLEKNPKSNLIITGQGQEIDRLRALINKLNIQEKVFLLEEGFPNDKMPEVYSSADIYVQPSLIEPYGIAVLEAMACGKPVIGTRVGGMKDTIEQRVTGFLVTPRDVKNLANKIEILIDNIELRNKMGKNARHRVVEKFDWNVIAPMYVKLFEECLKRSKCL